MILLDKNIQLFQSWAETVLMLILAIAYIITYIVQRNTIKRQKDQIESIVETNKSAKGLTDIQSSHIDTYQKMFDINKLDQYSYLKAKEILIRMLSKDPEMMDIIKNVSDDVLNKAILETNTELIIFLYFILTDVLKFDKETQYKIIDNKFSKGKNIVISVFDKLHSTDKIQNTQMK